MIINYKRNHWVILIAAVLAGGGFATDSTEEYLNSQLQGTNLYNPAWAGIASALLPGAGQFYTKKYFKAGTFVALEAITASIASHHYKNYRSLYDSYKNMQSGVSDAKSPLDSAILREDALLEYGNARESKIHMYNTLSWMVGGYVFNVLDAVNSTSFFDNSDTKDPRVAGWLAAIPGLGLGHLYNGSLSKAGFVIMTQVSLGVVAYNNHKLMREAEDNISRFIKMEKKVIKEKEDLETDIDKKSIVENVLSESYKDEWEFRQNSAFRNRNTYLWYSIFFYIYGILDAVVDAHLHDYREKMKLYPDLVPANDGAHLQINYKF